MVAFIVFKIPSFRSFFTQLKTCIDAGIFTIVERQASTIEFQSQQEFSAFYRHAPILYGREPERCQARFVH
ncbi:hypothetical protein AZ15_0156 [Bordetella bronchiseptica A1-7]|nr:hypothetical protein AZ15_0156 [Bordetella bronchiseptica A1-7]